MAITTIEAVRLCSNCHQNVPVGNFHKTANGRDGLHSQCKPCRAASAKARMSAPHAKASAAMASAKWRDKNPLYRRAFYTRSRFGLEPKVVDAFVAEYLAEHGPVCMSCGVECDVVGAPKVGGKKRLVLDHCHKTDRLRGMICDFCNTALGKLGDNAEGVRRLLNYIRRVG